MSISIKNNYVFIGKNFVPFDRITQFKCYSPNLNVLVWFSAAMGRNKETLINFAFKTTEKVNLFIVELYKNNPIFLDPFFNKNPQPNYMISENQAFKFPDSDPLVEVDLNQMKIDEYDFEKINSFCIRLAKIHPKLKQAATGILSLSIAIKRNAAWEGIPVEILFNQMLSLTTMIRSERPISETCSDEKSSESSGTV